jgi:spermidine/putrescine transport system substrate-binding protein
MDNAAITSKAPHRDLAERFINFLCEPKLQLGNAVGVGAAAPVKAALEFLPPDVRNNPAMYPPPQVARRLEFVKDLGAQTQLYDELWTQIKAK